MSKELNVIAARNMMEADNKLELIDVRKKEEFEKEYIDGFKNIPLQELGKHIPKLNTKKRVLLIDNKGIESAQAQVLLEACGFEALTVRGGYSVWKDVIIGGVKSV